MKSLLMALALLVANLTNAYASEINLEQANSHHPRYPQNEIFGSWVTNLQDSTTYGTLVMTISPHETHFELTCQTYNGWEQLNVRLSVPSLVQNGWLSLLRSGSASQQGYGTQCHLSVQADNLRTQVYGGQLWITNSWGNTFVYTRIQ